MKCYITIVLYNKQLSENDFSAFFPLLKSDFYSLIILDNTEEDISLLSNNKHVCKKLGVFYYAFGKNIGLSKAYNFAIKNFMAKDDWLLLLDQDTPIPEKYFSLLQEKIVNNIASCAFVPFFNGYRKNRYRPNIIKSIKKFKIGKTKTLTPMKGHLLSINSCSCFSRSVFDEAGLFNENLSLYCIDDDIFLRMAMHGLMVETVDVLITQNYFAKEKHSYKQLKCRLADIKYENKIFFSQSYFSHFSSFWNRKKSNILTALKFSVSNNPLYFIPLLFVKPMPLLK